MKYATIVTLVSVLQFSYATVDCRIACKRCSESIEQLELLEVYCAMCRECKGKRGKWMKLGGRRIETVSTYQIPNIEEDCPTQPQCNSNEVILTAKKPIPHNCPPIKPCKETTTTRCCIPFMPMCSCIPLQQHESSTTTSTTATVYLYIGIPKNIVQNGR